MTTSNLRRSLDALRPGESLTIPRNKDAQAATVWFTARENVEFAPFGLFDWRNKPDLIASPGQETFGQKPVPLSSVEVPKIVFEGSPDQLGDFYVATASFFISERLFRTIQTLDPEALDWIPVEADELPQKYYLCLAARVIDALDENATTITLNHHQMAGWSYRTVAFEDGRFGVSEGVPSNVHLFSEYFSGALVFSRSLVEAIVRSGARGMRFWPTADGAFSQQAISV